MRYGGRKGDERKIENSFSSALIIAEMSTVVEAFTVHYKGFPTRGTHRFGGQGS